MIEIIQEYWKSLLWTDGYRFTGVAITLWLLISSVVMGGLLAVILAVGRVSSNKFIRFSHLAVYVYFSRHAAVRTATGVLFGDVYAGDSQRHRSS
ncbi:histidine transport system permease [Salmonella enterica subsp. enterica]|uniref:Histidine transport system permease n=1 Tax=Salmonella enterica I TaxID=59201 RepID=A0A447TZ02_SALET|nr:histidine transport system permease [Salmonella enterica subsp. enterica]